MLSTKCCSRCKQTKSIEEFGNRKASKDGKDSKCKECAREYHKNLYHTGTKRKQQIRKNNDAAKRRLIIKKDEYLTDCGGCCDCGITDVRVLTFDHVNDDKEFGVAQGIQNAYSWERILREMEKCEVVCANCHMIRTRERFWTK